MKRKISVIVSEEICRKIMEVWKKDQEENLKSPNPRPIKLSQTAEKFLERGLRK